MTLCLLQFERFVDVSKEEHPNSYLIGFCRGADCNSQMEWNWWLYDTAHCIVHSLWHWYILEPRLNQFFRLLRISMCLKNSTLLALRCLGYLGNIFRKTNLLSCNTILYYLFDRYWYTHRRRWRDEEAGGIARMWMCKRSVAGAVTPVERGGRQSGASASVAYRAVTLSVSILCVLAPYLSAVPRRHTLWSRPRPRTLDIDMVLW